MDYKLNNLNQITSKTDDNWKTHTDYTYDKRGNNLSKVYYKNKKETLMGSYTYDETNRMVKGVNDAGEQSYYFFNGLGVLVTNEWIIAKNNHGYHDVTPNVESPAAALENANDNNGAGHGNSNGKTSDVIKDFVIDYNSYA